MCTTLEILGCTVREVAAGPAESSHGASLYTSSAAGSRHLRSSGAKTFWPPRSMLDSAYRYGE